MPMIIDRLTKLIDEDPRTQKDLCDALGIGTSTLNNWIKRHTDPAARFIIPICEFFGVSPSYLLTGEEQNPDAYALGKEDREILRLFHRLPRDARIEFKGEIKGYLKAIETEEDDHLDGTTAK